MLFETTLLVVSDMQQSNMNTKLKRALCVRKASHGVTWCSLDGSPSHLKLEMMMDNDKACFSLTPSFDLKILEYEEYPNSHRLVIDSSLCKFWVLSNYIELARGDRPRGLSQGDFAQRHELPIWWSWEY